MPLKLNVGLTQKVGMPDYGSLGASCHLEIELDPTQALHDQAKLKERIRHLHAICRSDIEEELSRRRPTDDSLGETSFNPTDPSGTPAATGATQRQLDYVFQLARQAPAVGICGLPRLVQHLFQKVPSELTSVEASALIDVLKDIRDGKQAIEEGLPGAAA